MSNTYVDYNRLAGVRPTEIGYGIKIGMRSGDMGDEALISKFDMSAEGGMEEGADIEEEYKNYGARVLTDRRPDPAIMAYEEQRRPEQFSSSGGILNLHYTGSRDGTSGLPQHPEIFLEETDPDPRGIDPMPQWQELRKQQEARTRFVRFHADADNSITGGGWDPNAARYGSRTTTQRMIQPRLSIFRTEKDGRREGLRREWKHKSDLALVDGAGPNKLSSGRYGELITDAGLNPQRKSAIISNMILKYTDPSNPLFHMYNTSVQDTEFSVAKYGEDPRKQGLIGADKSRVIDRTTNKFNEEDVTAAMKSAGLLIGDAVMRKSSKADGAANSALDDLAAGKNHGRMPMQGVNVAAAPYGYVKTDAAFDDGSYSAIIKNMMPQILAPVMTQVAIDGTDDITFAYEGQMLGGRVPLPFADFHQILSKVKRDGAVVQRAEEEVARGKMMSIEETSQAARRDSNIEVEGESADVKKYKGRSDADVRRGAADRRNLSVAYMDDVRRGLVYRGGKTMSEARITTTNDVRNDTTGWSDNTSKDRRIAPLGKKYMVKRAVSDGKEGGAIGSAGNLIE